MSALTLKASQRLASAAQVSAATDDKGAKAFVEKELSNAGLEVKSVKVTSFRDGSSYMTAVCRGPLGNVAFDLEVGEKDVLVNLSDTSGVEVKAPHGVWGSNAKLVLNKRKDPLPQLKAINQDYARALKEAHEYVRKVEQCREWWDCFYTAIDSIRKQMD